MLLDHIELWQASSTKRVVSRSSRISPLTKSVWWRWATRRCTSATSRPSGTTWPTARSWSISSPSCPRCSRFVSVSEKLEGTFLRVGHFPSTSSLSLPSPRLDLTYLLVVRDPKILSHSKIGRAIYRDDWFSARFGCLRIFQLNKCWTKVNKDEHSRKRKQMQVALNDF